MDIIEIARQFATRAHAGQFRRDGVTPYITHPESVAKRPSGERESVIATAWLHDVLEDTSETVETMVKAGISADVVEAVKTLTKSKGVSYIEYLSRVKQNKISRKVKIHDMLDNISGDPTEMQKVKYKEGLSFLC